MSSPVPLGKSFRTIFDKISNKKILTPYLDLAITSGSWPEKYLVTVDSRPYYGLNADGTPDGYYHPSTHLKVGARLLWYMMHPAYRDKLEKEPPSMQQQMTFAMGSALHAVVQTQFTQLGFCKCACVPGETHTCGSVEVEYINSGHGLRGRTDFIVTHPTEGPIVVELKTFNTLGFSKIDDTVESMKPEWKHQLNAALDNLGHSWGILLVLQAGWPYRFEEIIYNRDDALLTEDYAKLDLVTEALLADTPPTPCCAYNSKTMKSCPARYQCWLSEERYLRP